MKKTFLVVLAFAGMIALSLAFTKKEDPLYKNLKVLPKHINKEQLDSVMHHFTASLNVKCNFCHVRNEETKKMDFVSDDNKHKLVARNMMKMMDKINDKYFDVAGSKKNKLDARLMVTCYTCHHGNTDPVTIPPKKEERPQARPQADSTRSNLK
ncbi:MAG TPA: c-type cytochrome [Flavisolibacter sp.]|nr:c-type cytochrome [Flavisolibacter sp.]